MACLLFCEQRIRNCVNEKLNSLADLFKIDMLNDKC